MKSRSSAARYFARYSLTSPAYSVARRAGLGVRDYGENYLAGRLLDIGCGEKWKADLVGDFVDEYVGLDHEGSAHDMGRVDLMGTAYDIPQPDNSFDSILCTAVLEHLEEPAAALREALRVLRPSGYAIYTAPLFWHLHEEPRDFFRYTSFGLRHLFESSGWEIVAVEPLSGFWLTLGSEWNYYITSVSGRRFKWLAKGITAVGNLTIGGLDKLDRRIHTRWSRFSWMYLVVARKPARPESVSTRGGE